MSTWLIIQLIFIFLFGHAIAGDCPAPEISNPCKCYDQYSSIECYGNHNASVIKAALKRIAGSIQNQYFDDFWFYSNPAIECPARLTGDLMFKTIRIGNPKSVSPKLIRIHEDAFNETADQIEEFYVNDGSYGLVNLNPPYNIFKMLRSYPKLTKLQIISPKILHIPKGAFDRQDVQWPSEITWLKFGGSNKLAHNDRLMIDDDAFYHLEKLSHLDLYGNHINALSSKALHLKKSSVQLTVILEFNRLDSWSFAIESLNHFNRKTTINLNRNLISFLFEDTFQPFLDANDNRLSLKHNPINCSDCRNAWLVKGQIKYKSRVIDAFCDGDSDGDTVFEKDFGHCK